MFVITSMPPARSVSAATMKLHEETTHMGLARAQWGGLSFASTRPATPDEEMTPSVVKNLVRARHALHAAGAASGAVAAVVLATTFEHCRPALAVEPEIVREVSLAGPVALATWVSAILLAQRVRESGEAEF